MGLTCIQDARNKKCVQNFRAFISYMAEGQQDMQEVTKTGSQISRM